MYSSPEGSYYMQVARETPHAMDQEGEVCIETKCFILFKILGKC